MTQIHQIPDRERAREEAGDWIARLQSDEVSVADRQRFEQWRSAHAVNARAYEDMMSTWNRFADAAHTVRVVSFGNAMHNASRARRRGWHAYATAAAVAIVSLGLTWWWQLQAPPVFETGIGEHASVVLPDGSTLELNSNSKVDVQYSDGARVIHLRKGEAFFTVAHAPERPFWVIADRTWVRAVGTAFNVYRRAEGVRVTVSEGRIKVGEVSTRDLPTDAVLNQVPVSVLGVGQQVDMRKGRSQVRALHSPQIEREISWRGGTVYFEDRPLQEVMASMQRYTPLRIEVETKAQAIKIGGTFQTNPQGADALLTMLEDGLGLIVERHTDGRVRVSAHH